MFRPALAAALSLALVAGAAGLAIGQPASSQDPAAAPAGTYALDKSHASLIAKVKHLGMSDFTIRFNSIDASFTYDPANPTASKVTASADTASFDVGSQRYTDQQSKEEMSLNDHFIKQRDPAGGAKTPKITFASTSITKGAGNKGTMAGNLTLNGVTKPVTFDVTFNGTLGGMGPQRMGFSATGNVKRSDFGLTQPPTQFVGDDVKIIIEAEFTKQG